MGVPLFDCRVGEAGIAAMASALTSGQLASGAHVPALESELSARLSGRPVVAISDMTQAIELALHLAGIGPGDEVLTLSYNCMSSNSAIRNVGATAVWVDLDPTTATIDIDHARSQITAATRAIIVYHVAGYPADMCALRMLCDEAGLVLVEDANAALGGRLPNGTMVGTAGDYSIFSFYANRQVNAIEGAALLCRTEEDAARGRRWRRFGIDQGRFRDSLGEIDPLADILEVGRAATLSNVNAALARHNLRLLDARQQVIRANAAAMTAALEPITGIETVRPLEGAVPAFWGLLLLSDERDDLLAVLKEKGIGCSKLHQPNHVYSGFRSRTAALPGTDMFIGRILAIPAGWWVGPVERQQMVDTITGALRP